MAAIVTILIPCIIKSIKADGKPTAEEIANCFSFIQNNIGQTPLYLEEQKRHGSKNIETIVKLLLNSGHPIAV